MIDDDRRAAVIFRDDLEAFESAGEQLIRLGHSTSGLRLLAISLRLREQTQFHAEQVFMCDPDESGGLADVIELNGYSKRVPPKGCGT